MTINNDLLCKIYLAKKKVTKDEAIIRNKANTIYAIGEDAYLIHSNDKNDYSFTIFNIDYKKNPKEPGQDIVVTPSKALIEFYSVIGDRKELKISVDFDAYEKDWDVRIHKNGQRVPTYLKEALDELDENDRDGFINLIMAAASLDEKKEKILGKTQI